MERVVFSVYLFLFTLGPVQQFISQARKAQDLYAGSFLLSYLTLKGLEVIREKYGVESVIYPNLEKEDFLGVDLSLPNRFVALIYENDEANVVNLAKMIKEKVKGEWGNIVKSILNEFNLEDKIYSSRKEISSDELIKAQTKDFPEIYWVAVPLNGDFHEVFKDAMESDLIHRNMDEKFRYHLAYLALERAIGMRKTLRTFKYSEEYGEKCKVCGVREGVIRSGIGNLRIGKYISAKEKLCVTCFVKRSIGRYLKDWNYSFPSTAEVASASFKKRILSTEEGRKRYRDYVKELKKILKDDLFETLLVKPLKKMQNYFDNEIVNIEGEWFFEENVTSKNFEKELGIKVGEEKIKVLKEKLRNIIELEKPNPYYAIILFDGDNMGKWLSGEFLHYMLHAVKHEKIKHSSEEKKEKFEESLKNNILTHLLHSLISEALRNFSMIFVKKIVEEEHLGKVVYAGGDDVLAFVNIEDLFEVIRKLRAAFSGNIKIVGGEVEVDWENKIGFVNYNDKSIFTLGEMATASCGVVIAHYKEPLQRVLEKLRVIEKEAKKGGKDSFAISLLRRSGEEKVSVIRWKKDGVDVLERLRKLSVIFSGWNEFSVSDKIVHVLKEEFKFLRDKYGLIPFELAIEEIKRVVKRSVGSIDDKEKIKELINIFVEVFESCEENVDNFLNLLAISAFVGKGVR